MNFLTHILISGTLYRKLSKKMELDRKAFCYGNIKPDLSPQCLRNPHILENYLFIVQSDSYRLLRNASASSECSIKEFSTDLGVICHYICDFFCYCHLNRSLYNKLVRHFFYEIRLHLTFCSMLAGNQLKIKSNRSTQGKNIAAMVLELRKDYVTKKNTPERDLNYAIQASLRACEMIHQCTGNASDSTAAVGS